MYDNNYETVAATGSNDYAISPKIWENLYQTSTERIIFDNYVPLLHTDWLTNEEISKRQNLQSKNEIISRVHSELEKLSSKGGDKNERMRLSSLGKGGDQTTIM